MSKSLEDAILKSLEACLPQAARGELETSAKKIAEEVQRAFVLSSPSGALSRTAAWATFEAMRQGWQPTEESAPWASTKRPKRAAYPGVTNYERLWSAFSRGFRTKGAARLMDHPKALGPALWAIWHAAEKDLWP